MASKDHGVVRSGDKESIEALPFKDTMDQIEPPGPDAHSEEYDVDYYSTEPHEERIHIIPATGGAAETVFCDGLGVTIAGQVGVDRTVIYYDRCWALGPYPWPAGKDPTAKIRAEIEAVEKDTTLTPEEKEAKLKELNEELKKAQESTQDIKWVTGQYSDTETSRKEYSITSVEGSPTVFAEGQPVSRLGDKCAAYLWINEYDKDGKIIGRHKEFSDESFWTEASDDTFAF